MSEAHIEAARTMQRQLNLVTQQREFYAEQLRRVCQQVLDTPDLPDQLRRVVTVVLNDPYPTCYPED